ncbi:MAG: sigma 54-interacting transcriptional regulator [bacterium]
MSLIVIELKRSKLDGLKLDVSRILRNFGGLLSSGQILEGFVLNTSTRFEVYAWVEDEVQGEAALQNFLKQALTLSGRPFSTLVQLKAVDHFFRLAAGLLEQKIGDAHVLEEMKDGFTFCLQNEYTGPVLNRLFQEGVDFAVHLRQSTSISQGAVCIEEAVVEVIQKILTDLKSHVAVIAGDDEIGKSIARTLIAGGISRLCFTHPDFEKALRITSAYSAEPLPWDSSLNFLNDVDILAVAARDTTLSVGVRQLKKIMRRRGNRPLIVFDCGAKPSVDPKVDNIYNLFFYAYHHLDSIVRFNLERRSQEVRRAERAIDERARAFLGWTYSKGRFWFGNILAKSHQMQKVLEIVHRIAPTDISVLIDGESGTGKELVARAIHEQSHRADQPFIAVNTGALPETLLESELFGHVRGAFTGAVADKKGLFEEANRGTIFLDEIGDMSPAMQIKLLRVLQEHEIRRVGGNRSIRIDVRLIAATNRNLLELIRERKFRQDLYYRLNVIQITLAPLRERGDDILSLASHFVQRFSQKMGKVVTDISQQARELLMAYPWPGNVRELENAMERAVALTIGSSITPTDLPINIQQASCSTAPSAKKSRGTLKEAVQESEREYILKSLEEHSWNLGRAAEQMGIGRTTLWRKLKDLDINVPREE